MPALTFDLGGTHLRCAVAGAESISGVTKRRIETTHDGHSPVEVAARIKSHIEKYIDDAGENVRSGDPIVLAFPGPVDRGRVALSAPTLYGASRDVPDLAGDLRELTNRPVYLLNDVSAAAWGLSHLTSARRFLVITVSSGIGSKVFDRSNPGGVLDDPPFAGEIGHFVVDASSDAPVCDCGGQGHLGAIASGRGVERLARRARQDEGLTNERDIVPAIRGGEEWATDVLRQAMEPLARTLLAVTMAIGLEKVFVIGGFAQSIGPLYRVMLAQAVERNCRYAVVEDQFRNLIDLAMPDDELCLAGAAHYARTRGLTS
jgi:predicted NBD/HSP70 family sugar kinase